MTLIYVVSSFICISHCAALNNKKKLLCFCGFDFFFTLTSYVVIGMDFRFCLALFATIVVRLPMCEADEHTHTVSEIMYMPL